MSEELDEPRGWRRWVHGALGLTRAALGQGRAEPELVQERRRICRGCAAAKRCTPYLTAACACTICGCLVRLKTADRREKCPLGKW